MKFRVDLRECDLDDREIRLLHQVKKHRPEVMPVLVYRPEELTEDLSYPEVPREELYFFLLSFLEVI